MYNICSNCKQLKPIELEYYDQKSFHNKTIKLIYECKDCFNKLGTRGLSIFV